MHRPRIQDWRLNGAAASRCAVPEATSVRDDNRNVTKINSVPHRGFDANFHGDADDTKAINAAIAQGDVQRCAFERRHGDFVEDCLVRQWIHLRDQMESRGVPQEPRFDLVSRFHPLPGHSRTELRYATPISSFGREPLDSLEENLPRISKNRPAVAYCT